MTSVNEGVAGISKSISDSGAALTRAQDKIAGMQARSSALDELLESGVLEDVGGSHDDIQKELDKIGASSSVDQELAALKASMGPAGAIEAGSRELPAGARTPTADWRPTAVSDLAERTDRRERPGGANQCGLSDLAERTVWPARPSRSAAVTDDAFDLELAATTILGENHDVRVLLKLLVTQLSGPLGDRLQVERQGGFLRKSDDIKSVRASIGTRRFQPPMSKAPSVVCTRGPLVGRHPDPQRAGRDGRLAAAPAGQPAGRGRPQPGGPAGPREHRDWRSAVTDENPTAEEPEPADLPKDAGRRLRELEKGLFTSDLSVNEFLLIKEVGFHPLGFVMGSSIYHTGIQARKWAKSQELTKLTEAMYNARELAMTRMEEEAEQLGADGVVGVRLDVNYYEWGKDAAEFIAMGTAVKAESGLSYRNKLGKPFTSDLSGQDFWTIMQTGHVPQGLVMGTCVYHIAHRGLGQTLGSVGQNVELPNFTQALYEARELAMTRMQDEAERLAATGIVGVRLEEKSHMWGSHTIEFLSLGTAVVKTTDDVTLPTPTTVISLDN